MIYASIDIETTGLDPKKHDIVEFGALLEDTSKNIEISKLPKFHAYILPPVGDEYVGSPYALSMHPKIFRKIAERIEGYSYLHPNKLGFAFKTFLLNNGYTSNRDKITINVAGKNFAAFDYQFLLEKTDFDKHIKIRHRIIDPAILYLKDGDEALPGTSECLIRMQDEMGITREYDIAHEAIDDAIDVIKLLRHAWRK